MNYEWYTENIRSDKKLETGQKAIITRLGNVEAGQKAMQEDIAGLRKDTSDLKEGQRAMQSDINHLQKGQKVMRFDITTIKETVVEINEKLEVGSGLSSDEEHTL